MVSKTQNDSMTRVGPGSDAGQVLRHYWQPAALSDELISGRPVVPVRLLGEELVLFRDLSGKLGLIGRACPHRGVDLCFGRLEDDGLRCPFHGWQFGRDGQCIEQPGEPDGSTLYQRISTAAYPVMERNGIVFAYMGPGDPPDFPDLDCFRAPDTHVFAFKGLWECNWLQALEVGIDPVHASFLHRFLQDEDPDASPDASYGKQFRGKAADTDIPITKLLRDYPRPEIQVEDTEYGMRLVSLRYLHNDQTHVRVTNQIFPQAICIPMSREMTITQWHVPVDDENCYWYSMFTSFTEPVNKTLMREQRLQEHSLPDYAPLKNARNNYGYNAEEQKTLTYTGMGLDINVHDQWACESLGKIQDRTKEHLGTSDIGIIAYRRKLREAISNVKQGNSDQLPMRGQASLQHIQGPASIDSLGSGEDWQAIWSEGDAARRNACPWDAAVTATA